MMNELWVLQFSLGLVSLLCFAMFALRLIRIFELQAEAYAVAKQATENFYILVDELLKDPETPEAIKTLLYDVLIIVTEDEIGQKACQRFMNMMTTEHEEPHADSNSLLNRELESLSSSRTDLYNKVLEALREGIYSVIYSHAYTLRSSRSMRVTMTMAKTTRRSQLVKTAETFEQYLTDLRPRFPDDGDTVAA